MLTILFIISIIKFVTSTTTCLDGWVKYTGTEKCINGFASSKTFFDAELYCQSFGNNGTLVSIHNIFQNEQLGSIAPVINPNIIYWIGLSNLETGGNLVWTDGSKLDYKFCASSRPTSNKVNIVAIILNENNHWFSISEIFRKYTFICMNDSQIITTTTTKPTT